MTNRFFTFALEMFLGHLEGVGWSPACEKDVFLALVLLKVLANDYTLRSKSRLVWIATEIRRDCKILVTTNLG